MESSTIHVASGQVVATPGDVTGHLKQIADLSRQAAKAGARLILFAEGALTGYLLTKPMLRCAQSATGPAARRLLAIARRNDIVIVAGTLERDGATRHMSAFIAFPDGRLLVQRKHNLTPTELAAGLVPGPEERNIFAVDGVRFGVVICADSGIPDLRNKMVRWGAQVSLHPCAGGGGRQYMKHANDLDDPAVFADYLRDMEKVCFVGSAFAQARAFQMAMQSCNLSGDDGVSNYHPGHSAIVDCAGKLVGLIPGEYVVEYLRPQLTHGVIAVGTPRCVTE
jgi:predicted amidohydrolase